MTQIARLAMPLQIPMLTLLMLALAASTLLALKPYAPPRAAYSVASETVPTQGTPYGSGAAIRNLLF